MNYSPLKTFANREDEKDKEIGILTPSQYEQKFIK